jgi:endonuclease G, mitochondrial
MKNKALIGGGVALAVIVLIGFLCFWVGSKINDRIRGTGDTTNTSSKPGGRGPSAQPANADEAQKIYLSLGNPSNAGTKDANNYLMVNNYMAICYNRSRMSPNWVAWRVTKADMSDLERVDSFRPDDRLPEGWARATPTDYARTGYDRGHICPNADRNGSPDSMAATFLMTNMVPQTPDLNRGPWEKLEAYLRTLVRRGSDVYIVAGVYGDKGKIKRRITIPENCWKIAVAIPAGSDVSDIRKNTRVIAVDMPNVKGIQNADWQIYRTTVRGIEQSTGYNFLSTLPQDLQDELENRKDETKE